MKKTIVVSDEASVLKAIELIRGLGDEPPHEIEIRPWKRNRSVEQNRLYWEWLTLLSQGTDYGWHKEDWHTYFKHKYAVNIFNRDDNTYASMVHAVRKLKGKEGYEAIKRKVIDLTSTTDFNTKQMSEYMDAVLHEGATFGVVLPSPEDKQ